MTHSLHRQGTVEDLKNDYAVLAMAAKGINEQGAAGKLMQFLRIASQLSPVNMGDMKTGNILQMSLEKLLEGVRDTSIVHAVFTDNEAVRQLLDRLQAADLGVSVVVSGLFEPVWQCCSDLGLGPGPHTVNHSLGVWGKTELLPKREILEISTMCGHGMVSFELIKDMAAQVSAGKITVQRAAQRLARPCECGIFNPLRAQRLLQRLVSGERR